MGLLGRLLHRREELRQRSGRSAGTGPPRALWPFPMVCSICRKVHLVFAFRGLFPPLFVHVHFIHPIIRRTKLTRVKKKGMKLHQKNAPQTLCPRPKLLDKTNINQKKGGNIAAKKYKTFEHCDRVCHKKTSAKQCFHMGYCFAECPPVAHLLQGFLTLHFEQLWFPVSGGWIGGYRAATGVDGRWCRRRRTLCGHRPMRARAINSPQGPNNIRQKLQTHLVTEYF